MEPGRARSLVRTQPPNVYAAILFVHLVGREFCSNPLEGGWIDGEQLQQIPADSQFLPRHADLQTVGPGSNRSRRFRVSQQQMPGDARAALRDLGIARPQALRELAVPPP